jgi:peptidoglycan/LPS O-acetylase OafA/YrhL
MLQDLKDGTRPGGLVEPYMGNLPLWSLSYEWWFYMLYFPLVTWIKDVGWRSLLVFSVALVAAVAYTLESGYVLRLLMYFPIWWSGVCLAEIWLHKGSISFRDALPATVGLGGVALILLINLLSWLQQGNVLEVGFHPFLELRHIGFALVLMLVAIAWGKLQWLGFDWLVRPFLVFAPILLCFVYQSCAFDAEGNLVGVPA